MDVGVEMLPCNQVIEAAAGAAVVELQLLLLQLTTADHLLAIWQTVTNLSDISIITRRKRSKL